MQPGYPVAALSAFYLIHDRIVGGKAAERVFFHLDTHKSYPGVRRGGELSFGFRRNSQPVTLGESHFPAVDTGFALAGNNAVYLFVALVRMDKRNACAVIGLLVVYCFKDVASSGTYGIPEILSVLLIIVCINGRRTRCRASAAARRSICCLCRRCSNNQVRH